MATQRCMPPLSVLSLPFEKRTKKRSFSFKVNSGDFKLISDFELKSAIEKHYREYLHMQRSYDRRDNFNKKYMADFFVELDYDAIYAGKLDFMDDKRLRNMIFSLRGVIYFQLQAAEKAKKSAAALLNIIQEKLY